MLRLPLTIMTGLMRHNECPEVKETLKEHLGINLTVVDGSDLFYGRLAGVTEPEAKRKIIGATCRSKGQNDLVANTNMTSH